MLSLPPDPLLLPPDSYFFPTASATLPPTSDPFVTDYHFSSLFGSFQAGDDTLGQTYPFDWNSLDLLNNVDFGNYGTGSASNDLSSMTGGIPASSSASLPPPLVESPIPAAPAVSPAEEEHL